MQGSTMTMTSTTENLVTNQFPQPIRPPKSYAEFEILSTSYPQTSSSYVPQQPRPQSNIEQSYMEHVVPPTTGAKVEEGEKKVGVVDKVVNKILDKYEKIPASIREQVNLEEIMGKAGSRQVSRESSNSRGLGEAVEGEQLEKLERFRIRTVVAGEVVTEDDNK